LGNREIVVRTRRFEKLFEALPVQGTEQAARTPSKAADATPAFQGVGTDVSVIVRLGVAVALNVVGIAFGAS
jgi:hypothetical protein